MIIEKLDLRYLEVFSSQDSDNRIKVDYAALRVKEDIFNEMLEALIKDAKACEQSILESSFFTNDKVKEVLEERLDIVEKATGKSWEEIKVCLQKSNI